MTTGQNLLLALYTLHLYTKDQRFDAAIKAITENGVVDGKGRFKKNWKSAIGRRADDLLCVGIDDMSARAGWSVRNACAEFAAASPIHAASFDAAVKLAPPDIVTAATAKYLVDGI